MTNKTISRSNSAGLGLIETLIIIAVVGLVAFFGFTFYKSLDRDDDLTATIVDFSADELDEVAKTIVSDLGIVQARSKTGADGRLWGVCFVSEENEAGYNIVSNITSNNEPCEPGDDGVVESTVSLPDGVLMSDPSEGNTKYVVFRRVTGGTTSPRDIRVTIFSGNNEARTITITPDGIITYSGGGAVVEDDQEESAQTTAPVQTASATSAGIPSSPRNLAGSAGVGVASIAWTPSSFSGGSEIIEYRIYRSTNPNAIGTLIDSVTPSRTAFLDRGVSSGVTYFYRVTARNAVGESAPSGRVSVTPFASTTATSVTTQGSTTESTTASSTATTQETETVTETVTETTAPSAPRNLRATPGDKRVSLSWGTPSLSGSSAIEGYLLYRSRIKDGTGIRGTRTLIAETRNTSFVDSGLNNDTRYYYSVVAKNDTNTGPMSEEVMAIPRASTVVVQEEKEEQQEQQTSVATSGPSAPRNVSVTQEGSHAVIKWSAPSSNGGTSITDYKIGRSPNSNGICGGSMDKLYHTDGNTFSFPDINVEKGKTYYYRVWAGNEKYADGTCSMEVSITIQ